jgi:hypothetical protein
LRRTSCGGRWRRAGLCRCGGCGRLLPGAGRRRRLCGLPLCCGCRRLCWTVLRRRPRPGRARLLSGTLLRIAAFLGGRRGCRRGAFPCGTLRRFAPFLRGRRSGAFLSGWGLLLGRAFLGGTLRRLAAFLNSRRLWLCGTFLSRTLLQRAPLLSSRSLRLPGTFLRRARLGPCGRRRGARGSFRPAPLRALRALRRFLLLSENNLLARLRGRRHGRHPQQYKRGNECAGEKKFLRHQSAFLLLRPCCPGSGARPGPE